MNSMIYEIESIFDKPEISFEDISELQYMDIMYEGKVTEFIKSSYDKGKKLVSAIFSWMKTLFGKSKGLFIKIGQKIKALWNAIMSKIKRKKEATEAFDLFGIEAEGVDESLVTNVNKLISISVAIAVSTGVVDGKLILKNMGSGFLRGFIGWCAAGLLYGIIYYGLCLVLLHTGIIGVFGYFMACFLGLPGSVGTSVYGAVQGVRFPDVTAGSSSKYVINAFIESVLGSVLTKDAKKRVRDYAMDAAKQILSKYRQTGEDTAESIIGTILSKNDWVTESDIVYNESAAEKMEKFKSVSSKKALDTYKKQLNESSSKFIKDAVDAVTKEDFAKTMQDAGIEFRKLMEKIGLAVAE